MKRKRPERRRSLLVPGGQGTRKEMHSTAMIDWIRRRLRRNSSFGLPGGRSGPTCTKGYRPIAPDCLKDDDAWRPLLHVTRRPVVVFSQGSSQ
jgi:hypothetical protein